jgi:cell division protein FtsA
VAEIIESRLAEIMEFVNNELKLIAKSGQLAGGIVLTGGTAKLPGIAELAKGELKLSSQIGFADLPSVIEYASGHPEELAEDPEFSACFGLMLEAGDQERWWKESGNKRRAFDIKNLSVKKIVRYFSP